MMAEEHLTKEMALYDIFCEIRQGMTANIEEGEQQLAEIGLKRGSIRRRHKSRRRVYDGVLGEILLFVCDVLGTYPELTDKDREGMKLLLESLADRHLAGEQVLHPHFTGSQSE